MARVSHRMLAAGGLVAVLIVAGAAMLLLASDAASLKSDGSALARVGLPLGGGRIESVSVTTGPHSRSVPVILRGTRIWPSALIGVHQRLQIEVVVKRPGWISWLAGSTERLHLTLTTPATSLRSHYLTLAPSSPLTLRFKFPIRVLEYGPPGHLVRRVLAHPLTEVRLARSGVAGTIEVAAAPRTWELPRPAAVSWFPTGSAASAVAQPAPGSQISPHTPITLTFNKTVGAALGSGRPPISPMTPGSWHTIGSHTIQFQPRDYGYGLGAHVTAALPRGVTLVGGQASGSSVIGSWSVPGGSPLRVQQLLAQLGYLPLRFNGPRIPATVSAQESAAVKPPKGSFHWRYGNVPSALRSFWSPGSSGVMTRGALMAFENDHGLAADGVPGVAVWKALIQSAVSARRSTFGYTFVSVSLASQRLSLWHDGKTVLTTPVNTGIASQPTATGTYPVFEHLAVTTMSGTNPDGSHYSDPGIQYVSYFNGGDALHAFTRAQYGFPQSLGCVEMALAPAGQVWPYTPIGTLVHVA